MKSTAITEKQKKQLAEETVFQVARIRNMAELAPISFPNVFPERDISLYLSSKIHTQNQLAEPNPDEVAGPGVELLSRKRMLELADERLRKIRVIAEGRKTDLNKEWQIVNNLQAQLRESTIAFETFIKENMEKRERAEKKIHEELSVQNTRRNNIDLLVYQMRKLYEVKKIFESNIRSYKMYENYLQKVVGVSEYKDVDKVMQRFSALQEAKQTAFEKSQDTMCMIESSMAALKRKNEENGFTIIGKKNKLCELHTRFGEAQKNALLWETTVTAVRDQCLVRYRDWNTVEQVCQGLYELMCRRKGEAVTSNVLRDSDHEYQMIAIGKTLLLMEKILRMVKDSTLHDTVNIKTKSHISNASSNRHTSIASRTSKASSMPRKSVN